MVKQINIHVPESLYMQIKNICKKYKSVGLPSTMRIVVLEFLQKGVSEYLQKQQTENVPSTEIEA